MNQNFLKLVTGLISITLLVSGCFFGSKSNSNDSTAIGSEVDSRQEAIEQFYKEQECIDYDAKAIEQGKKLGGSNILSMDWSTHYSPTRKSCIYTVYIMRPKDHSYYIFDAKGDKKIWSKTEALSQTTDPNALIEAAQLELINILDLRKKYGIE